MRVDGVKIKLVFTQGSQGLFVKEKYTLFFLYIYLCNFSFRLFISIIISYCNNALSILLLISVKLVQ